MKGKVIPLKPRFRQLLQPGSENPWSTISDYVQPHLGEADLCLQRSINKSPDLIRDDLLNMVMESDWICPALFLSIAQEEDECENQAVKLSVLAAALESLQAALRVHRSIKAKGDITDDNISRKILSGDYLYSLALVLAADMPVVIRGMAEIISRSTSSEIDRLSRQKSIKGLRQTTLKSLSDSSASPVALAATLGAWYKKLEPWENEALAYFGHYTGLGIYLKRQLMQYEEKLQKRETNIEISLPVAYILERSTRRTELFTIVKKGCLNELEYEFFVKEHKKLDPKPYMEKIAGNCLIKAREFLELLQGSLSRESINILSNFIFLE